MFDATGVRLRTVPFRPDRVKAASLEQLMIQARRNSARSVAEILGVDAPEGRPRGLRHIRPGAWLDYNVVVVPGQELELDDFVTYSRRFGQVVPHPSKMTRHPERPEITLLGVNKFGADGALDMAIYRRGAEGWHTDGAYDQEPFKATQLYALAIPSRGGDTHFASMYAAYDALPPRLKQRLDGPQAPSSTAAGARRPPCSTPRTATGRRSSTRSSARIPRPAARGSTSIPGKILRIEGLEAARERRVDRRADRAT